MNRIFLMPIISFVLINLIFNTVIFAQEIKISDQELVSIGDKIFENECASKNELLLQWNEGEEFLSLGIGHFIWYPKGVSPPFRESFPLFVRFAKTQGANIPGWLNREPPPPCPWRSRYDFTRNLNDKRIIELRVFLTTNKRLQAQFMVKQLNDAMPSLTRDLTAKSNRSIKRRISLLSSVAGGRYALVDYSNFKGLGILSSEQYNGEGWGLLQVLSEMRDRSKASDALIEFVEAAKKVLARRVKNAPPGRNEERWLPGWRKRLNSYLE